MEKSILNFLMLNKKQIFGPKFVYNMNPIDIKKKPCKNKWPINWKTNICGKMLRKMTSPKLKRVLTSGGEGCAKVHKVL